MKELDKIEKLIKYSGNNFHCKVLNYLKKKEWTVLVSPYYSDNVSDKPREIDLIAEKAFTVNDPYSITLGEINVTLFVECKYIPQEVVFWFHDKDVNKARELVLKTTPLRENNLYTENHHYLTKNSQRVAKLFASDNKKNVENEPLYKALNQSLNAMVYYRGRGSIIPPSPRGSRKILASVNYPVIICNSFKNFYQVDIESTGKPKKINDNFQLEVNYAYMNVRKEPKNEYFLIDVLDYEKIDTFLEALQKDVDAIVIFVE